MGISGLLKFVKEATEPIQIKKYAGKTVAVDTYCWIHRGSFACAEKLAKNENTDQYVKYCLKFIDMLESFHVKPILVFDGCRLPSKELVEQERHKRRKENLEKGKQFLREGKLTAARDCFTKCISVTPAMALKVIEAARSRGVDCIVAPYEADAQLAFLVKSNIAQAVVTEDSDLLCFGCKNVIFKMDLTGRAQEVSFDNFDRIKSIRGFTPELFRHMCILSGCDYLPSVKGVGLVKACKALKLSKSKDSYQVASRLHQYIKGLSPVDPSYGAEFERADKTFLYQFIFDPRERKLKPLNNYPDTIDPTELEFAGPFISDEKALQIALGNIDINTQLVIGYFDVNTWLSNRKSGDHLPSMWDTAKIQDECSQSPRLKTDAPTNKAVSVFHHPHPPALSNLPQVESNRLSANDVCEAMMEDGSEEKENQPLIAACSPQIKDESPKNIIASEMGDLIKSYEPKVKTPSKIVEAPSIIVKSRFFVSPSTSQPLKEFESFTNDSGNNSNSLFSDQKSVEDSVLDDILSEMTEQAKSLSTVQKRNTPPSSNSLSKRKKTSSSIGESFKRLSCGRKKRLNLHCEPLQVDVASEKHSDPEQASNQPQNDETIPLVDNSSSLFDCSMPGSASGQSSQSGEREPTNECDEAIPILDFEETPRKPLRVIADENTASCSTPSQNTNSSQQLGTDKRTGEGSSKCQHRRLGLPSRGRFTKSPVKLKLSKYFSGSKVSGLRKTALKSKTNQPSIKSFFSSKA